MTTSTAPSPPEPETPVVTAAESRFGRTRSVEALRNYGILVFLTAMFVALSLASSNFLTANNLKNVIEDASSVGMIACAGTIVMIAGGFDLSAGSIFAATAVIAAKVSNASGPELAVVVAVVAGCGMGLINGVLTTYGRINPFVGTLGTMIAYDGVAVALTGSGVLIINNSSFANIGNLDILGFAISSWYLLIAALVCGFLLNRTVFGQHVFAAGGNRFAALLSGVPINRTLMLTYVLSGCLAAIAGLSVAAQSLSVDPTGGDALIFQALAAIMIGGNSIWGGEGAIWRTIVGVFITTLIVNGFNLLGINPLYQQIANGVLICVAVGTDTWVRRRA